MSDSTLVRYCAEQCKRQGSGEISVADMYDAWMYACEHAIDSADIVEALGKMVEPTVNASGFRRVNVRIGGQVKPVVDFRRAINLLLFSLAECNISPNEAYREFEELHPFEDGNGRVGAILFNKWCSSMWAPQPCPEELYPDFFSSQ